jgi:D-alanine transaminase
MRPLCSLNGQVLPLAEARIDPQDRGFLFGDAIYEVVKVLDGVLLHLNPHLERLQQGLQRAEIAAPGQTAEHCRGLVKAAELRTGYLYLQVSRGIGPRTHLPPADLEPTVLILAVEQRFDPPASRSLRVITVPDWRWQFRDLKTTSLMATVIGKLRAREEQVDEVLFLGPGRELREGGSTSVFVRRSDRWETHPTDGSILEGVTRATLLTLAEDLGMALEERAPRLSELEEWQEALLCGTTTGVQPLVAVDGLPVAGGAAGDWTRRLGEAFEDFERRAVAAASHE